MKKFPTLVLAVVVLGTLVWLLWPRNAAPDQRRSTASVASKSAASAEIENPKSKIPAPAPTEIAHLADALNSPTGNITADLHLVADVLENFRSNFPRDGNPVGSNAEITAALTGRNKLRYAALPPDHPAINRDGELCDRWGTPFFFHAESGTRMTIRSAGPDKKMWTADDLEFTP
jgi:hypothetical protein